MYEFCAATEESTQKLTKVEFCAATEESTKKPTNVRVLFAKCSLIFQLQLLIRQNGTKTEKRLVSVMLLM